MEQEEKDDWKHHETELDLIYQVNEDVVIVDVPVENQENEDYSEEEEEMERQCEVLDVFLEGGVVVPSHCFFGVLVRECE